MRQPLAGFCPSVRDRFRHGEYFRKELYDLNSSTAQYPTIDVDTDVTDPESGGYFLPKDDEIFTHDLDGNLTADGRWNYEWDAENRLVVMRSLSGSPAPERRIEFEYDWQGRRIRKTVWNDRDNGQGTEVSDTIYAYDGWNLIGELEDDLTPIRTYVWGLDMSGSMQGAGGVGGLLMLNDHTDGNKHHFVAHDGNGNVVALVDESDGTYSARYEYGPFGESIRGSGDLAKKNPFRFSCKFTDNESGLVYYGHRYYYPPTGRFLSRDPMGEQGGLNLYAFVANSPVNEYDYLGLKGNGHHRIPWHLFNNKVSKEVQKFFDSDAARIFNDYYKTHNSKFLNGISHPEYSSYVKEALDEFLGETPIRNMTVQQARQFLNKIDSLPASHPIRMYNTGVADEAAKAMKKALEAAAEAAAKKSLNRALAAGARRVGGVAKVGAKKAGPVGLVISAYFFIDGQEDQGIANQLIDEANEISSITPAGPIYEYGFRLLKGRLNTHYPEIMGATICNVVTEAMIRSE